MATEGVLRRMHPDDVPAVMAVQEPASVAGLSEVFPQDVHPFPREVLAQRWRDEIADPALECFVVELAGAAHDELLARMLAAGVERSWLRCHAANPRGRAFWEKHGWVDTGGRGRGPMPPHAELMTYAYDPDPSGTRPTVPT